MIITCSSVSVLAIIIRHFNCHYPLWLWWYKYPALSTSHHISNEFLLQLTLKSSQSRVRFQSFFFHLILMPDISKHLLPFQVFTEMMIPEWSRKFFPHAKFLTLLSYLIVFPRIFHKFFIFTHFNTSPSSTFIHIIHFMNENKPEKSQTSSLLAIDSPLPLCPSLIVSCMWFALSICFFVFVFLEDKKAIFSRRRRRKINELRRHWKFDSSCCFTFFVFWKNEKFRLYWLPFIGKFWKKEKPYEKFTLWFFDFSHFLQN